MSSNRRGPAHRESGPIFPIAQLRYDDAGGWTLYFGDRYGRWIMYFDLVESQDIETVISELSEALACVSWG
jgi:hypothetical protein